MRSLRLLVLLAACCGLALSISSASAQVVNERTYVPIEIKCPMDNKGVLELINQNQFGAKQRTVVGYESDNASYANASYFIIYTAEPGAAWTRYVDWNYATGGFLTKTTAEQWSPPHVGPQAWKTAEKFAHAFRTRSDQPDGLMYRVCRSDGDERSKALEELAANRRKLGLPT